MFSLDADFKRIEKRGRKSWRLPFIMSSDGFLMTQLLDAKELSMKLALKEQQLKEICKLARTGIILYKINGLNFKYQGRELLNNVHRWNEIISALYQHCIINLIMRTPAHSGISLPYSKTSGKLILYEFLISLERMRAPHRRTADIPDLKLQ